MWRTSLVVVALLGACHSCDDPVPHTPADAVDPDPDAGEVGDAADVDATAATDAGIDGPPSLAPPLDPTVERSFADEVGYLYTGPGAPQTGVAPGTIAPYRVTVLRGLVRDRAGAPLAGVAVTAVHHPELGTTATRADGTFSYAVNGGEVITLDLSRAGYLPAQRAAYAPWEDYAWVDDTVLVALDPAMTPVSSGGALQVAVGSVQTDADGPRQATVLFPAGTAGSMVMADGSTQPLPTMSIRLTEYTVGGTGLDAMPGALPPASSYTYAVEVSADEALGAGARELRFDRPVALYVDNFLGFPVGSAAPQASYSRAKGKWIAERDGRVIAVLTGGGIDLDGNGIADGDAALTAEGIDAAERTRLAALYPTRHELWRVTATHFSPRDINWPRLTVGGGDDGGGGGGGGAGGGGNVYPSERGTPTPDRKDDHRKKKCNCAEKAGSTISVEPRILGEDLPIAGTPFQLHYQGDRVPGRTEPYTITIPLTPATRPSGVARITADIEVAGQRIVRTFEQADLTDALVTRFTWDGRDGEGRALNGARPITVAIRYYYDSRYLTRSPTGALSFAVPSSAPATQIEGDEPLRAESFVEQLWRGSIGAWTAHELGPGWTLTAHHTYTPGSRSIHLGDGGRRDNVAPKPRNGVVSELPITVPTYPPPTGGPPIGGRGVGDLAAGPDGALYLIYNHYSLPDPAYTRLYRRNPDATLTDLGPAEAVEVGPDGVLYLQTAAGLARLDPDEASPVAQVILPGVGAPYAVGPDGVYFVDGFRLMRLNPDGSRTRLAGTGVQDPDQAGDGGPAAAAGIANVFGINVGPDGAVYFSDSYGALRIRRIRDGVIDTVVGGGARGYFDSAAAREVNLGASVGFAVAPDSSVYVAPLIGFPPALVILRTTDDGALVHVAGNQQPGPMVPGYALDTPINTFGGGLTFSAADGSYYLASAGIWRIARGTPLTATDERVIASDEGNQLYVFDAGNRHVRTVDATTQAVLFRFGYDPAGHLITVADAHANVTTIERGADGAATAIVSPYGRRTTLGRSAAGDLTSVTDPLGRQHLLGYGAGSLLASRTEPGGARVHTYVHDALGRLSSDTGPDGRSWTLATVSSTDAGYVVSATSAGGVADASEVRQVAGGTHRETTAPSGERSVVEVRADGSADSTYGARTETYPDGTVVTVGYQGDPRFAMDAPFVASARSVTPSGHAVTRTHTRAVTTSDPVDPLTLTTQADVDLVNGRTVATRAWTAATRTWTTTSAEGRTSAALLDATGLLAEARLADRTPIVYARDGRGRITGTTQGPRTTIRGYDAHGNLIDVTDELGHTSHREYDALDRLTASVRADGERLTYGYAITGETSAVTPPGRPPYLFAWTAGGQPASWSPPDVGAALAATFSYDADRRLDRHTRLSGMVIDHDHDAFGRLQYLRIPGAVRQVVYDPTTGDVARVRVTPTAGTVEEVAYARDSARLTGLTWTGTAPATIGWTHDGERRIASVSVGGVAVGYGYDGDGEIVAAGALAVTRHPTRGAVAATDLGVVADAYGYDGFGDLASHVAGDGGGTTWLDEQLTRDAAGRVTALTEVSLGTTTTWTYGYDLAGRLDVVQRNGSVVADAGYDANGNRTLLGAATATFDAQDRILTRGATSYTHDLDGQRATRVTAGGTTRYGYDALGNLLSVTLEDGRVVTYTIGPENQRLARRIDGVISHRFVYDGRVLGPIAEVDAAGAVVTRYVYLEDGDNLPAYLVRAGVTYRIIADHRGSPRFVVNSATGAVAQRLDYDAFGAVVADTAPGFQPFGFGGGLYDPLTGLVRLGARDYDAEAGRWTARDPLLFGGGDTNLYAYATGDPIDGRDPTGLDTAWKDESQWFTGFSLTVSQFPDWLVALDKIRPLPTTGVLGITGRTVAALGAGGVAPTIAGVSATAALSVVAWGGAIVVVGQEGVNMYTGHYPGYWMWSLPMGFGEWWVAPRRQREIQAIQNTSKAKQAARMVIRAKACRNKGALSGQGHRCVGALCLKD